MSKVLFCFPRFKILQKHGSNFFFFSLTFHKLLINPTKCKRCCNSSHLIHVSISPLQNTYFPKILSEQRSAEKCFYTSEVQETVCYHQGPYYMQIIRILLRIRLCQVMMILWQIGFCSPTLPWVSRTVFWVAEQT